jgi:hypothetical protein
MSNYSVVNTMKNADDEVRVDIVISTCKFMKRHEAEEYVKGGTFDIYEHVDGDCWNKEDLGGNIESLEIVEIKRLIK